jgi:uncharacterized protein with PIN domain
MAALILTMFACGSGTKYNEKVTQLKDSIAKAEKQKVLDSVKHAANSTEQNIQKQQMTSAKQAEKQFHDQQQAKEKQDGHVDEAGGIHFGQPK